MYMYACVQSCLTLYGPLDCSLPDSSVHGILQARILDWVAISSSGDLPDPGIKPRSLMSPAVAGGFFSTSATWEAPQRQPDESKNYPRSLAPQSVPKVLKEERK